MASLARLGGLREEGPPRARACGLWNPTGRGSTRKPASRAEDYLVFGRETAGLPKKLVQENPDRWLRIPMFNAKARSLNLSNCVALVLFEALRQQGFKGEG